MRSMPETVRSIDWLGACMQERLGASCVPLGAQGEKRPSKSPGQEREDKFTDSRDRAEEVRTDPYCKPCGAKECEGYANVCGPAASMPLECATNGEASHKREEDADRAGDDCVVGGVIPKCTQCCDPKQQTTNDPDLSNQEAPSQHEAPNVFYTADVRRMQSSCGVCGCVQSAASRCAP